MSSILITGASGGIGAALAEQLATQGHSLLLVARRADALQETVERCGGDTATFVGDMTVREEVRHAIDHAIERFGAVDVLVNNVGRGITRSTAELTDDDIDDMMRVNVKSALYGMQEILPHFIARGTGQIVNVSSMLGRIPSAPFRSAYIGAKHVLNAITATLRADLAESHPGIVVSLVSPGIVRTDFGINAMHGGVDSRALPYSQSAEEAAAVIARVIETRAADVYTAPGSKERVRAYFDATGEDG